MKVFFITTRDFGEISLATFFSRNQPFETVIAIPEIRADYFDEMVNILYVYTNIQDLKRYVLKESPDVIAINTAYLIINGALASKEEFIDFIDFLKSLEIPIITSDPFVRVYDNYPECRFSLQGEKLKGLESEMTFLGNYLKDIAHFYGFPCKNNFEKTYTFYNDKFCVKTKPELKSPNTKNWLFVLGELDFNLLLAKYKDQFLISLIDRLKEVCSNKNNTVRCVFPLKLAELVAGSLQGIHNLKVSEFLSLSKYEQLIRSSDIVFYWNVFSNSILMCKYYNIPFLCFEKGHIAELSTDLFKNMSDGIYHNGTPEFLNFFSRIESDLEVLLKQYFSVDNRNKILEGYNALPSPHSIIQSLIND
ncbi:hypothetical protein [Tenacibaculum sp. nBUS_03]|uniref:hypothetical protein n=1 Tax=Tenacibaculum sp. nBUS_03 TaxID=3395320 RepID=UPI003EC04188